MQTPDHSEPQSTQPLETTAAGGAAFQPMKLVTALSRFWWVPVLTTGAGLAGTILWFLLAPPTYVSKAALWETEKMKLPEGAAFSEDQQNYMGTQVELLRSDKMKESAWERLRTTGFTLPLDRHGKPIEAALHINQPAKSTLIFLEASSPYPAYTKAFLEALMNEYLEYKKSVRKVVSGDTLTSISEQVLRLERELKENQDGLAVFQRSNNLAVLVQEGTIAGTHLAQLKTRLSDLELEAKLLEASAREKSAAMSNGIAPMNAELAEDSDSARPGSASLAGERQMAYKELQVLQAERDKLARYLRSKHPRMIKINEEIERAQKIMEVYRTQTEGQLEAARASLKTKRENVLGFIKDAEIKVADANARIAEGERLKQNVARIQSLYDRLVLLLQNVDISRNVDQPSTALLQTASEPKRSLRQDVIRSASPMLGGMVLGAGILLVIALRDDRFNTIEDLEAYFGDVTIGQVPDLVSGNNGAGAPGALIQKDDTRHSYIESYRSLRSAIHFLTAAAERPRLLLVTSAAPGEGKSSVAANLARAMAMGGGRILLVDADMRRGRLDEALQLQRAPGLAELLRNSAAWETALQTDLSTGMKFIGRGGDIPNPGDLLLSRSFSQFLERARREYDYVVLDSCPVFAADDATTVAPKVEATLFIVRSGYSRSNLVSQALDMLQRRQARLMGIVLNRVNGSNRSGSLYEYAEYHRQGSNGSNGK